jgi:hypothetical protein
MDKLAEALRSLIDDLREEEADDESDFVCPVSCDLAEQVLRDYDWGLLTAEAKR